MGQTARPARRYRHQLGGRCPCQAANWNGCHDSGFSRAHSVTRSRTCGSDMWVRRPAAAKSWACALITRSSSCGPVMREAASCGHAATQAGRGDDRSPIASQRSQLGAFNWPTRWVWPICSGSGIAIRCRSLGIIKMLPYGQFSAH